MRVRFEDRRDPKLCHARPGDIVMLLQRVIPKDDKDVEERGDMDEIRIPCIVCAFPTPGARAANIRATHGLYDDERFLFLVEVETGIARKMPHLSSRMEIISGKQITISVAEPRD